MVPGEALAVALCQLITELIKGQTPEQRAILWDRYIEWSKPFHDLLISITKKP